MGYLSRLSALTLLTTLVFLLGANNVSAKEQSIREKLQHSRAIEAAVWGMPLMNFKGMRDGTFANDVTYNDVTYYSKIQTWRFQAATPNDTTPYWMSYWNVKNGPVVIEIPASTADVGMFGTLMDAWQRPLEDVGAKGADVGKGGKYFVAPPNYKGEIPEGYIIVHQNTFNGYTVIRPIIKDNSQKSIDKASAFVKDLKVYNYGEEVKTRHVDLSGKMVEAIAKFDDTYYDGLNEILQEEKLEEKDKVMMGMLKSLGMQIGKPYNPTTEQREMLKIAAKDAHDYMLDMYHNVLIPPYYEGKYWTNLVNQSVPETGFTLVYPDYVDVDNRGALYYAVVTSVKNFGAATYYLSGAKDQDGNYLDGGKTYTLHVDANVPAKDFWSAVVYDLESATWIRNQSKVGVASTNVDLQTNEDGSVDLYFGPKAPKDKESNWVPTTPGQRFFLLFRFYGPDKAVFDKSWQLNNIELIK